jgi:hypothetical protein
MDVEDIAPGQDFADKIEATISACQAVVVVIGPGWVADLKSRSGGEDFVRHEVSVALRRRAAVIPVLVGGAGMPKPADLPEGMAALVRHQALEIRDITFDADVKRLVSALQNVPGLSPASVHAQAKRWAAISIAAVLCVAAAVLLMRHHPPPPEIGGRWIVEMQKPAQRPFRVRLELAGGSGRIIGTVRYPTGDGSIQEGTLSGNRLAFFTVHVPQFATEPATIRWTGVIDGDLIRFTAADDNGIASGVAKRSP